MLKFFSNDKNSQIISNGATKLWWLNVEVSLSQSQKLKINFIIQIIATKNIDRNIIFFNFIKSFLLKIVHIINPKRIKLENRIKLCDFSQYKGNIELLIDKLEIHPINSEPSKI